MPKPTKKMFSEGEYVTVYRNNKKQLLFPPADKSLIVKARPKSFDVQTLSDEIWKVRPEQLKAPKKGFFRPEQAFLRNLVRCIQNYYDNAPSFYFSKEWLKKHIDQIKKNYLVKDAYITKRGNLLVITRSLPTYDWNGKKLSYRIGKMAIKINPMGGARILVRNLDWVRYSLDHPHIDETGICLGGAEEPIAECWPRGDLFSIVEIMLAMLTQFDINSEEYTDWLEGRTRRTSNSVAFMEGKARVRWN